MFGIGFVEIWDFLIDLQMLLMVVFGLFVFVMIVILILLMFSGDKFDKCIKGVQYCCEELCCKNCEQFDVDVWVKYESWFICGEEVKGFMCKVVDLLNL